MWGAPWAFRPSPPPPTHGCAKALAECDRYVVKLGGESPLRTLVRGTVSEGKGVHREVESEESRIQNVDLTNRKYMRQQFLD